MNGRGEQSKNYWTQSTRIGDPRTVLTALLIGVVAAPTCRADSQLRFGPAGSAPLSASAHIDFRITVLSSLSLTMQAQGAQLRSNFGVLTLQSGPVGVDNGAAPSSSQQLRPRNLVIDTELPRGAILAGEVVTVASP